jgi:uncharacterized membrane protein YhaH (DUF805 family)
MGSFLNTRINRASYGLTLLVCVGLLAAVIYFTGQRVPGEAVLIFVCVPRLHDIGWSGWWAGGMILVEILAVVAGLVFLPVDQMAVVIGLYVLLLAVALIILGLVPGQPGPNRYGEPPAPGLSFGRRAESPDKTFS